jgi:predicted permease
METFWQDIQYGLRLLRKDPGFTAVAVITLALGIGANAAIFSLVDGILLRALPYSRSEQLISVTGTYPRGAFVAMREQMRTIDLAAYAEGHEFNLTGRGEPVRLTGTMVSAEMFSILGVRPELGRAFSSGEDLAGQDSYVVLSYALWKQRFGGDPAIIGRSIELEGAGRQVLGVMPPDFHFPSPKTQVWIPLHNDPRNLEAYWAGDFMPVIGRLRPGATLPQAQAEVRLFQSQVPALFPWTMPASWNASVSVIALQNGMVADVRLRLLLLLGAAALVLLIACANVANLTLSRAAAREKEMGIRSALGAKPERIARQLLTESVVLASLGGLVGLAVAAAGLALVKVTLPAETPRLGDVHLNWQVLAFTAAITILTGLIFGLAPVLRSTGAALTDSMRAGGRGVASAVSPRLRASLVVAEIGLAVLLIVSAGLLIRSFWTLSHLNPGFRSDHLVTARITPNEAFCSDSARCLSFYRNTLEQVQGSAGVDGAALVNTLPLGGRVSKRSIDPEGFVVPPSETSPVFWLNVVTPDYFRVMGMSVLSGTSFSAADLSGNPPVAVVTAATARRFWPDQNAVGKHVRFVGEKDWRTVIGVIADVRAYDLEGNLPEWIKGTVYVPFSPRASLEDGRIPAEMTIALRTSLGESQAGAALRRIVGDLNQDVPVSEVKTMGAVVSDAVSTPASTMSLFVAFAGLALILGMVGIYGVLSFLVAKRTREIGIRIALGAQRRNVLWLVMREGARFALLGIALGLTGAFLLTRFLSSELYGISPIDPVTYLGVAVAMAAITLLACYVPARRAMRVDPLIALRYD